MVIFGTLLGTIFGVGIASNTASSLRAAVANGPKVNWSSTPESTAAGRRVCCWGDGKRDTLSEGWVVGSWRGVGIEESTSIAG